MSSELPLGKRPAWMTWTGRVLSTLVAAAMFFSAAMKFSGNPEMAKAIQKMGYTEVQIRNIGVVEIVCAVIYLIPQTAVLGAILLTGYLGGATATHVRIDDVFFAPVILGVVVWIGLYLRDSRVSALAPVRRV
jgi:hypothetical protein